ncbi:MAG: hypothetical protein V1915_03770 [Candidatus Bathyarchaeota archaeon]
MVSDESAIVCFIQKKYFVDYDVEEEVDHPFYKIRNKLSNCLELVDTLPSRSDGVVNFSFTKDGGFSLKNESGFQFHSTRPEMTMRTNISKFFSVKLKGNGAPQDYDAKMEMPLHEYAGGLSGRARLHEYFGGMPHEGEGTIELKDHTLKISGKLPNDWFTTKEASGLDFEGEGEATFRFEHVSKIFSQSFWGKGSGYESFFLLTLGNGDKVLCLHKPLFQNKYPFGDDTSHICGFLTAFFTRPHY